MVNYYNFKSITVVPDAKSFVDIVLSKLQRKTPTVIRKRQPIPSIRKFYTRKVRTAQQFFVEKLDSILQEFPHVEKLHPFYNELIRVHYDKDKYVIALSNISKIKRKVEKVGQDIVRRLKYGESLYQCKCQKRAALGQMVKYVMKLKETLAYLEEVRQKMSRLPCVDPNLRTLILCGFPNVGKSSFMNKITRADVEVQAYAFTTKHLYLGHTEFQYGRYQVIDTPGLLDRDLSDRNETEWATITALTCLDACILYIMDVSQQCGKSLQEQAELFNHLRPCFKENPIVIAVNKTDSRPINSLNAEERLLLDSLSSLPQVHGMMEMSTLSEIGVMEVRNKACSLILERRIEEQVRQAAEDDQKLFALRLKTTVAVPTRTLTGVKRPAMIPESVLQEKELRLKGQPVPPKKRRKLERDIELEQGEDYVTDLRKHWQLENDDEKHDVIPEIWNGHNIIDFYDPDIKEKLALLEEEEARLEAAGFYEPEPPENEDDRKIRRTADKIKKVMAMRRLENREKKCNKPRMGRREADSRDIQTTMSRLGVEVDPSQATYIQETRGRTLKRRENRRSVSPADHARSESRAPPRSQSGVRDQEMLDKVRKMNKRAQVTLLHRKARKGEADRHIPDLKPKHLFSGKRGIGKTDRR